jgi:hypothetical protein
MVGLMCAGWLSIGATPATIVGCPRTCRSSRLANRAAATTTLRRLIATANTIRAAYRHQSPGAPKSVRQSRR